MERLPYYRLEASSGVSVAVHETYIRNMYSFRASTLSSNRWIRAFAKSGFRYSSDNTIVCSDCEVDVNISTIYGRRNLQDLHYQRCSFRVSTIFILFLLFFSFIILITFL